PTTSMYLDFGTLSGAGIVSGYMEIKGLTVMAGYTPIQFYGKPDGNAKEVFGLRLDASSKSLFPRFLKDGANDEKTYAANKAQLSKDGDLAVAFTFNTANKELTITAGGNQLVKLTLDYDLIGIRFCSGGNNDSSFKVDNVAVKFAALTADEYRTQVNEKVAALETEYSLTTLDGYADIKAAYTASVGTAAAPGTATNFAEIDSAYTAYETAVLAAYKTASKTQIDTWFPASSYTTMATELAAALKPFKDAIDGATTLAAVKEQTNQTTIQAALTAAKVRTDEELNGADIIIAFVDSTGTSVGGVAKGTYKDGDKVTKTQLADEVTAPAGKKVSGFKIGSTDIVFGEEGYTLSKATGTGDDENGYTITITVVFEDATTSWTLTCDNAAKNTTLTIQQNGLKAEFDGTGNGDSSKQNAEDFKFGSSGVTLTITLDSLQAGKTIKVKVYGYSGSKSGDTYSDVDLKLTATNATAAAANPANNLVTFPGTATKTEPANGTFVYTVTASGDVVLVLQRNTGKTTRLTKVEISVE
ncbi:MAG: hypothetical protein K2N47_03315, partial [Clostridia bacterium]|nr:hypothetical protein [Clostridia bacterium]